MVDLYVFPVNVIVNGNPHIAVLSGHRVIFFLHPHGEILVCRIFHHISLCESKEC